MRSLQIAMQHVTAHGQKIKGEPFQLVVFCNQWIRKYRLSLPNILSKNTFSCSYNMTSLFPYPHLGFPISKFRRSLVPGNDYSSACFIRSSNNWILTWCLWPWLLKSWGTTPQLVTRLDTLVEGKRSLLSWLRSNVGLVLIWKGINSHRHRRFIATYIDASNFSVGWNLNSQYRNQKKGLRVPSTIQLTSSKVF